MDMEIVNNSCWHIARQSIILSMNAFSVAGATADSRRHFESLPSVAAAVASDNAARWPQDSLITVAHVAHLHNIVTVD